MILHCHGKRDCCHGRWWGAVQTSTFLVQGIVIMGNGGHVGLHVDAAVLWVLICYLHDGVSSFPFSREVVVSVNLVHVFLLLILTKGTELYDDLDFCNI